MTACWNCGANPNPPAPTAHDVLKTIQMLFAENTGFGALQMTTAGASFVYQGHRYNLTATRERL